MKYDYLTNVINLFNNYKSLGEKAIQQIPVDKLTWQFNDNSNSIATIVKHLHGNMLSRWTDFLTSDGEKEWRDRDSEFENDLTSREEILDKWNEGWDLVLHELRSLEENDLTRGVLIRNEKHSVLEAINRQLTHYSYHVGQIVFIGKMICDENWASLSVPRGKSGEFNAEMFSRHAKNSSGNS